MKKLTVKQLGLLVERVVNEERSAASMRAEVKRALGPAVIAEGTLRDIAVEANDRIEVLERTGRASKLSFDQQLVSEWCCSKDIEVRKLAAHAADQKVLRKLAADRSSAVRAIVAKRVPLSFLHEMKKRFSNDDQLACIYEERKLVEGIPVPKQRDQHLSIHHNKPLGDAVKQDPGDDLSDRWYEDRAIKFMMDYGTNLEDNWEEILAHRYVSSIKATSGVEVDEKKMLNAIKDQLKARDERAMSRNNLKIKEGCSYEEFLIKEQEEVDLVSDLLEKKNVSHNFLNEAKQTFRIREASLPAAIMNVVENKRMMQKVNVPASGRLPHSEGFRAIDERALDMFCEAWNAKQKFAVEPLCISWFTYADSDSKVGFSVELR